MERSGPKFLSCSGAQMDAPPNSRNIFRPAGMSFMVRPRDQWRMWPRISIKRRCRMCAPSPPTPLAFRMAAARSWRRQDNPSTGAPAEVVAIYAGACANCHNDSGAVGPSKALPLSLSSAVQQSGSANTIRVILNGILSYRGDGGPYMPAFDGIMTDKQIAALAQYLRARYSSQPQWTDVQEQISKARQEGS